MHLLVVELLSILEVGKVPMVCEDLELLHCTFKEVAPLVYCMHDSHHLLVMDLVVVLYVRESLRHEGNWPVCAICLHLGEYCSSHKVGGITFKVEAAVLRWEGEDRGRGDSSFSGHRRPPAQLSPRPTAGFCK